MAGETEHIHTQLFHIQRNFAKSLGRICMEKSALGMRDFSDITKRMNDPNFVIQCHYGHQRRAITHRIFDLRKVQTAIRLRGQNSQFKPGPFTPARTREHARMFSRDGHDVRPITPNPLHQALDRKIIGFCHTRRKGHLAV